MFDLTLIPAALSATGRVIEGFSTIQKASRAMGEAELQLEYAKIASQLVSAQLALAGAVRVQNEMQAEIERLKDVLRLKDTVGRSGDAYYSISEVGELQGSPYCMNCYEQDHRLVSIAQDVNSSHNFHCPACKTKVQAGRYTSR